MAVFAIATGFVFAQDTQDAAGLYARTEYERALIVLQSVKTPTADQLALMGKCQLMLGEFKKATATFQKAVALDPNNADYVLWLGRTWGRRAETASPFVAPSNASKARDCFEKALALDPNNRDALGDLFDYYLDAPGFLGGGADKAEALARRIEVIDPPQGHFLLSEVARKRQQPGDTERELRIAVKLAPTQVGHVIALARFLARQSRLKESDAVLAQADRVAPGSPRLLYAKASIYIETHRKLDQARALLETYLRSPLTPDDPSREAAEKLLKQANGG
jgi:cytochrome c-type biogenesis protein CcmH/NrfG